MAFHEGEVLLFPGSLARHAAVGVGWLKRWSAVICVASGVRSGYWFDT